MRGFSFPAAGSPYAPVAKGEQTLSVLDYGTPGADDTAMVQDAVNASAATGRWLLIIGDRPVAGMVTAPSGAKIDCSQGRLIQQTDLTTTLKVSAATGVRIRSPRIVGKSTDYVNTSGVYAAAGIWIAGASSDVVIEGGTITGCAGAAVRVDAAASDFHIRNVKMVGPGAPPIVASTSNYGGGVVGVLNVGLNPASECAASVPLAPGATQDVDLASGLHKFQCCIHPWIRAAIRVE